MLVEVDKKKITEAEEASAEAKQIAEVASAIKIKTSDHYLEAGECLKEIKTRQKELEAQRKTITKPLMAAKRSVAALFSPPMTSLKDAETAIKKGMTTYQRDVAERQEKALRDAKEASEEGAPQAKVRKLLDKAQVSAPKVEGVSIRKVTKFEIEDEELLPRYLLEPDMKKIRNAVLSGTKVPGVRVWEEDSIAAREA